MTMQRVVAGVLWAVLAVCAPSAYASEAKERSPTGSLSPDKVTGQELNDNDRSIVVLIHGWNPNAAVDKYADGEWQDLVGALNKRLTGTATRLCVFHWEYDAATGPGFDWNDPDTWPVGFSNASSAAANGFFNGDMLADLLTQKSPNLRRVTFIAHSAGTWVAYQATTKLLTLNPYVVANVVLLDPFIPGVDPSRPTALTTSRIGTLAALRDNDRIYRLENYYSRDKTDTCCHSATSQVFGWRDRDINQRVDYNSPALAAFYYDEHSGPIRFLADTVTASTPGQAVPRGLALAPWSFASLGFSQGLEQNAPILPFIASQPSAPSVVTAGSRVTLTVSATRTDSFQWYKDGKYYANTSATLVLSSVAPSDAGVYVVRAKNKEGMTFSDKVVLTVVASDAASLQTESPVDGTVFRPGDSFNKSWTFKNAGTTTWNSGYTLRFVRGGLSTSRMERFVVGNVLPGNTFTFQVPMRAPATPATYREDWQFVSPSGRVIAVGSSPTVYSIISVQAIADNKPTGYFDFVGCSSGYGWAWDPDEPNAPMTIQIRDGATVLQSFVANEFRPDLIAFGNGQHAFNFATPSTLHTGTPRTVRAVAVNGGQEVELFNSPRTITCASSSSDCSYAVSTDRPRTFAAGGGSDAFEVTTGPGCSWRVSSDAPWLTMDAAVDQVGSQWISYSVSPNTSSARRVGTVVVEGNGKTVRLPVTQEASTPTCSYSLSATERNALWAGNQDSVTVSAPAGCTWSATASSAWLDLQNVQGTGTGTLTWSSDRNPDTSIRAGTIQIYGQGTTQTLVVRQDSYPTYWPHIDVPAQVTLGKSLLGATIYQSVVVRNTGNTYLTISSLEHVAGSTAFSGHLNETWIESGGTTTVTFAFSPTGLGPASATFRIGSNDPDRRTVDVTVGAEGVERTTGGTDLLWTDLPVTDDATQGFRFSAAVVIQNAVYVVGGDFFKRLYRFDPTVNVWTRLADAPLGLLDGGAAAINGKIYAVGSQGNIQIFEPVANNWTLGAPLPTPRQGLSVAAANGRLYTFGGGRTGTVEEYDPVNNSWRGRANMPTPRDFSTAVTVDNRIYVLSGQTDSIVQTTEVYDPATNTWTTTESMPSRRRLVAAVAVGPRIFVIGGLGLNEASNTTVEELNTSLPDPHPAPGFQDLWFSRNSIQHGRYGAAAAAVNGHVYVIGGQAQTSSNTPLHVVEEGSFLADADVNVPITLADFGNVEVGSLAEVVFEIQNRGSALLTLGYRRVDGTDDVRIVESSSSVAPGESRTFHLRFRPATTGPQTSHYEITTNDPDTPSVVVTVVGMGLGAHPAGITTWKGARTLTVGGSSSVSSFTIQDGKAYLTRRRDAAGISRLTVVNMRTGATEADIAISSPTSFSTAELNQVAVIGNRAYVAMSNLGLGGRLAVVDLVTRSVQTYLDVGADPFGVVAWGTDVFVSNAVTWSNGDPATVRVVDTRTLSVTSVIPVGVHATRMAVDAIGGRLYVANAGGSVSVIDLATRQVVATIAIPAGPRVLPLGVAISGPDAYVATSAFVEIADVVSTKTIGSLVVEDGTTGVAADERHVFAASSQSNVVTIVDTVTHKVVAVVPLSNGGEVIIDRDTGTAWVARADHPSLTAVELIDEGFSIRCAPQAARIVAGGRSDTRCLLRAQGDFASNVTLSCSGAPLGLSCDLPSQVALTGNGTAEAMLALTNGQAFPGIYRINVTATSGSLTRTAVVDLTVASCDVLLPSSSSSVPSIAVDATFVVQNAVGCQWTATSQVPFIKITGPSSGSGVGTVVFHVDANSGPSRSGAINISGHTFTVTQAAATAPSMTLDKNKLGFSATLRGPTVTAQTGAQIVRLVQGPGTGIVTWTATSSEPWLQVSPSSGTGSRELSIRVAPSGLPANGTFQGTITLTLAGASNSLDPLAITLATAEDGASLVPFGYIDTPIDNTTGVTGAIPFTGWTLDDVEVARVTLCRAAFGSEVAPIDTNCGGEAQIYVGDAVFIDGARPDVLGAYPGYPLGNRAGWGFMVLTNMLPNQGNGSYRFYAYATDREKHTILLGTRTIICANAQATKPFGAIDTPLQGGVASGNQFVNFGWALTQTPKVIPVDGSTIQVLIDGAAIGTVDYNHYRPDVATLFPGLQNSNGAVGFRILDTTALTNGLHTISWTVTDSGGATEGIGSRFFLVANGAAASTQTLEAHANARIESAASEAATIVDLPVDESPIRARVGWDLNVRWRTFVPSSGRGIVLRGEEIDRFELWFGEHAGRSYDGYLRTVDGLSPLPAGSQLHGATGWFTWAPGAGFVGAYDLLFVRRDGGRPVARQDVRIVLAPKGRRYGGVLVEIDTPRSTERVEQPFLLGGWAGDLDSPDGSGIETIHVWAYPTSGGPPVFVGTPILHGGRSDVASVHGERFRNAGFELIVRGLPAGAYDFAVFPWSSIVGGFAPPRVIRVVVP